MSGTNGGITRGMTEDRMLDRLESWARRGGSVEMARVISGDYNSTQSAFHVYVLKNESGEPRRYIVPGREPGEGYRSMGRAEFSEFMSGPDRLRYQYDPSPLRIGPAPAARFEFSTYYRPFEVNPADMRASYLQRQQAAAAVPPVPAPVAVAPLAEQVPVTSLSQVRSAFTAAATGTVPSLAVPKATTTVSDQSLPQYANTNAAVADMMRDGARVVKLGRNEGDIMVAVGRDGRVIAGIDPDQNDPSKSTIYRGAALTERLAQDGNTAGDFERFAASLQQNTTRPAAAAPLAVSPPAMPTAALP